MGTFCCISAMLILSVVCRCKTCPKSELEWKLKAARITCEADFKYHCLMGDNNVTMETCLQAIFVQTSECPVLVNGTMKFIPCKKAGCPSTLYLTSELYSYPVCFGESVMEESSGTNTGKTIETAERIPMIPIESNGVTLSSSTQGTCGNVEKMTPSLVIENDDNIHRLVIILIFSMVANLLVLIVYVVLASIRTTSNRNQWKQDNGQNPLISSSFSQIYYNTSEL